MKLGTDEEKKTQVVLLIGEKESSHFFKARVRGFLMGRKEKLLRGGESESTKALGRRGAGIYSVERTPFG